MTQTVALPEKVKQLLDATPFVTVATVNADGTPQTSIMWIARDGDTALLSTLQGRLKERNWRRNPVVSVLVPLADNPYGYLEIRGTVTMTTDGGPELIQTLSRKYTGGPYTFDGPDDVRVVVRVNATRVVAHNA